MLEEQKKALRRIKKIDHPAVETARNALVCGCIDQGAYIQFAKDVTLYGLYEALLYAQNYEERGCYAKGTTTKATNACLTKVKF
jgi:hypothetical protein